MHLEGSRGERGSIFKREKECQIIFFLVSKPCMAPISLEAKTKVLPWLTRPSKIGCSLLRLQPGACFFDIKSLHRLLFSLPEMSFHFLQMSHFQRTSLISSPPPSQNYMCLGTSLPPNFISFQHTTSFPH